MSSITRRGLLLALTLCGVLTLPAIASAATLTDAGGVLTYAGGDGSSDVNFEQTSPTSVRVRNNSGDTIVASGCTETGAGSQIFDCPAVASIVGSGNGGDDFLGGYGVSSIPQTQSGGAGDDTVYGGGGNDSLDGGAGEDYLSGQAGTDDVHGGTGIDYSSESASADPAPAVNVTLDDQGNDGGPGENDNVHSDVENVESASFNAGAGANDGPVTVRGSAGSNSISVYNGKGNLDAGAGNDSVTGGSIDDMINSVDGFADVVTCGAGNDTVSADQFDTVSDSCENVTRTQVGNANQDKQPTVAWTSPAEGTTLPTTKATTLTVNASDDTGLTKVQFLAGTRIVCEDTTAPYTCAYTPNGSDSGKQVLSAVAIDSGQQTATALRAVKVARFSPKISEKVSPSKDIKAPFKFRVTGTLTPPTGMSKAEACGTGVISTSVKAGKKTISTRRVNIKSNCTYSSTTSFKNRSRFGKASKLKITVRFGGNSVLASKTLTSKTIKVK